MNRNILLAGADIIPLGELDLDSPTLRKAK